MIERDGFGRAAVVAEVSRSAPQPKRSTTAALRQQPKKPQPKQQKEEKQESAPPPPLKEHKMATKTAAPAAAPLDSNATDPVAPRGSSLTHQTGTASTTPRGPSGSGGGANTSGTSGPQPAAAPPAKSSNAGLLAGGLVLAYFLLK